MFPAVCKLYFHGTDPYGTDCKTSETGRTRLQDLFLLDPCAAKKLEASRKSVRSYVDFVLTFEEVQGMFEQKVLILQTFLKKSHFLQQAVTAVVLQPAAVLQLL